MRSFIKLTIYIVQGTPIRKSFKDVTCYQKVLHLDDLSTEDFIHDHVLCRKVGQMWNNKTIGQPIEKTTYEHKIEFVSASNKVKRKWIHDSFSFKLEKSAGHLWALNNRLTTNKDHHDETLIYGGSLMYRLLAYVSFFFESQNSMNHNRTWKILLLCRKSRLPMFCLPSMNIT